MDDVPLRILLLVFLTLCNAFFASAEIALLQINDAKYKKLAEAGDKKAKNVLKLTENSSNLLSNIQVGVTLSGFLASAFAADSFAEMIADALIKSHAAWNKALLENIAVVLITVILSYFTLVFGELVPKRLAMKKPEKIANFSSGPLRFTGVIFKPFILLLSASVNLCLRILGIDPSEEEEDVTEEEILLMVNEGQEQGTIDDDEGELINNVFDFDDISAGEIMTNRTEIVALPVSCSYEELVEAAVTEMYSRIPIFDGTIDNIIGFVHVKSLLGLEKDHFSIRDMLLPVANVPESQKIDGVLETLKKNKIHLAVVLDEFGGTAGILTMEDIIEELVGNIQDEYDQQEEETTDLIIREEDNVYRVDGQTELSQLNDYLNLSIPNDDYSTVSGFAVACLGEIPEEGTNPDFTYENLRFSVLESNAKIITSLRLEVLPPETEENNE